MKKKSTNYNTISLLEAVSDTINAHMKTNKQCYL